jgi:hypothetical protein
VIDPLIFSLELEQPEFVAAYRNATAINGTRAGSKDAEPAPPTA